MLKFVIFIIARSSFILIVPNEILDRKKITVLKD